uniref:Uncharacterized protein n=1 Tax=Trichobilharzia regenti TaxID=157069 RepID=A0AA85JX84_TRIRE|nr:unnamed protein product [Trichobilharzia regenti]
MYIRRQFSTLCIQLISTEFHRSCRAVVVQTANAVMVANQGKVVIVQLALVSVLAALVDVHVAVANE